MNANAPLEASNLNNPCPAISEQVGHYTQSTSNTREYTWTHNTINQTICALRHAASVRMDKLKLPPTASYDFFDTVFTPRSITYPVTMVTLGILQNHETPPTDSSYHPSQEQASHHHIPQPPYRAFHTDDLPDLHSTMNISHIQTRPPNNEDETMSVISHATESLTLSQQFQSTPKRPRHSPDRQPTATPKQTQRPPLTNQAPFVNFLSSIEATPAEIRL